MNREVLTASMMGTLVFCMRKFFYRYELGLQSAVEYTALSFGSAWHRAMEARWRYLPADTALLAGIGQGESPLDELAVATLSGLLAGYYQYYSSDPIHNLRPEQEFRFPLPGSRTFDVAGKIDGIGILDTGRPALLEHKTTSDSVTPDSYYWLRLRCNNQIMQYVHAARTCGQPVDVIYYDVTRKPSIRPKLIPILDEAGLKIVLDASGQRVMKKDGKPRESAGEGMTLQSREETAEEFGERLREDSIARPEFYFARREVPILDQDLEEFVTQRLEISRMILSLRRAARSMSKPHQAWPRNCSERTCGACEFREPCLQGLEISAKNLPVGFVVGTRTPELTNS